MDIVREPAARVSDILRDDAELYERKSRDYAPDRSNPWENIEFSANFATRILGSGPQSPGALVLAVMMGVKLSRLMTVSASGGPQNESFYDTLRDLRVYTAMLEAYLRKEGSSDGEES